MTGVAFLLFTYYMVTDSATTPVPAYRQAGFGVAVTATYGLLVAFHIVFGLLFALTIVCLLRSSVLYAGAFAARRRTAHKAVAVAASPVAVVEGPVRYPSSVLSTSKGE